MRRSPSKASTIRHGRVVQISQAMSAPAISAGTFPENPDLAEQRRLDARQTGVNMLAEESAIERIASRPSLRT